MSSVASKNPAECIYSHFATHKDCVLVPFIPSYVPWNGGTGQKGSYIWKCPKQIQEKESEKVPKPPSQTQSSWPHWRGHFLSSPKSSSN
jgi:hypothetical protein